MKKRVLITGVYSGNAIKIAIAKLSLDKIYLVLEKDYDCKKDKSCLQKQKTVDELMKVKQYFGKALEFELLKTESVYNIFNIAEEVIKQIDKIPEEDEIYIHVSEGTKIMSFALNLAGNARKDRISEIYYIIEENNEIIKLPILHFPELNKSQEDILKLINKGVTKPDQIIIKLKKSKSVIYQNIKQLQQNEYVIFEDSVLSLAPLGKLKMI